MVAHYMSRRIDNAGRPRIRAAPSQAMVVDISDGENDAIMGIWPEADIEESDLDVEDAISGIIARADTLEEISILQRIVEDSGQ